MFTKEAIQEIAKGDAIRAAALAIDTKLLDTVALPSDFALHDLEPYLQLRRRARGTMTTSTPIDFSAYAQTHKQGGATVFVDPDKMSATAVLNLGNPEDGVGHADNLAVLALKKTAAYSALQSAAALALTQAKAAEFLEDWPDQVQCFTDDGPVSTPKAIAALRKITIEGLRKLESSEQSLSSSRGVFESVQASSADPIPTFIYFKCVPFLHLPERTFVLRLGIQTGTDKPAIVLRVVKAEQHAEDMADELATIVREAIGDSMPVVLGQYTKK